MGRFWSRRSSEPSPPEGGAVAFWAWWTAEGRDLVSAALARAEPEALGPALTAAVHGLHPGLAWEVGPGDLSAYVLVVTAGGDPALRAPARRWLLAAPEADASWSFSDQRSPVADPGSGMLDLDGGPAIDLAGVVVSARATGSRFDVTVHHPAFAGLSGTDRERLAFLALDQALGEVDVELWIGQVATSEVGLVDGFGLAALRSVVGDLRSQHLDADGRPTWAMLRGETPEGPLLALARTPLHPLTEPLLTRYAAVVLPCSTTDDDGLPTGSSLDALRGIEQTLEEALGSTGAVVAHQSCAGVRTLHLYLDETTDALSVVRRVAGGWPEGRSRVESSADPSWDRVRHLRS